MTDQMELVIVPTYNERENLPVLTHYLMRCPNVRVMIVDIASSLPRSLRITRGGSLLTSRPVESRHNQQLIAIPRLAPPVIDGFDCHELPNRPVPLYRREVLNFSRPVPDGH